MNVLILCTGNSYRSILAEAAFNHLAPAGWHAASAGCHSKSWDRLAVVPDIVITVCGSAAAEECPAYLGSVLRAHWGVEEQAYRVLRARIEAFSASPLEQLKNDPDRMKTELDRIGAQHEQ